MIIVVQRVCEASVYIDGGGSSPECIANIGRGVLALVGVERGDTESITDWCADKLAALRIFPDENGKMNHSLVQVSGAALVVSQFTLAGQTSKGSRPNFTRAESPEIASALLERFSNRLEGQHGLAVATGKFGAMMRVELVNDGPVTLIIERRASS